MGCSWSPRLAPSWGSPRLLPDRTVSNQKRLWSEHNVPVSFTVLKHQLDDVKSRFDAEEYYHIGDTELDEYYSGKAGFLFLQADASAPLTLGINPSA